MTHKQHEATVAITPFDLHATMAQQVLGHFDPTGSRKAGSFGKVHLDDEGRPVIWRFDRTPHGVRLRVSGSAADDALGAFLARLPPDDGCDRFRPQHPVLRRIVDSYGGLRLLRVPWAFDVAAGAVLQQRVRWKVAYGDFRRIAIRWGTPTPAGVAFPTARQIASRPAAAIEAMHIDPKRARALHALACREASRPFLNVEPDPVRIRQRLVQLPGIGAWTANMVAGYAAGDPDAVPTGDLHLPSLVTATLADEPEGSDERMLEVLEPWRGQRFRVLRLLTWAFRRAPRLLAHVQPA